MQAGHGARGMYASILAYSPNTDLLNATLYEALQQQSYSLADLQCVFPCSLDPALLECCWNQQGNFTAGRFTVTGGELNLACVQRAAIQAEGSKEVTCRALLVCVRLC